MEHAVKGGFHEKWWKVDLFIGKEHHEGEWRIGKVLAIGHSYEGLWIWNVKGSAVNLKKFYLLKYNSTVVDANESGQVFIDIRNKDPALQD